MADIGFVWDEDKYEQVKHKHGVKLHEVVSVFDDPDGHEVQDPNGPPD